MAKAYFVRLDAHGQETGAHLSVQFNPTEYTTTKGAQYAEIQIPGIDAPLQQFVAGQAERITLDLFFDSTEDGTGADATPVTNRTNEFFRLVKMSGEDHAPPRLRLFFSDHGFPGVVADRKTGDATPRLAFDCVCESVQQRFTLFSPDGVPLRARLTVGLRENRPLEQQLEELDLQSPDHTRLRVIEQGETLPLIAYRAYGSAAEWRRIAVANGIDDPRSVPPGTVLELPPTGGRA
jgi:nucleoid-associated protein YgaU